MILVTELKREKVWKIDSQKGVRWRLWNHAPRCLPFLWWNSLKTFQKEFWGTNILKFWEIFYEFFNPAEHQWNIMDSNKVSSFVQFLGKIEQTLNERSFLFVKNSVSGIIWLFLQWHSLWRCHAVLKLWIKTVLREENIVVLLVVFRGKKWSSKSSLHPTALFFLVLWKAQWRWWTILSR